MLLPNDSEINSAASGSAANGNIVVIGNILHLGSMIADQGTGISGGTISITAGRNAGITDGTGGGVLFDSTGAIINGGSFNGNGIVPTGAGDTLVIGNGTGQTIRALGDISMINRNTIEINLGTGAQSTLSTRGADINITTTANPINVSANKIETLGGDLAFNSNNALSITTLSGLSTASGGSAGTATLTSITGFSLNSDITASSITMTTGVLGFTMGAGNKTLTANSLSMTGILTGPASDTLTIQPFSNGTTISVGAAGTGTGTLDINATELASISVGTLKIGSNSLAGGLTVEGNLNIPGAGSGSYDLIVANAGNVNAAGRTINIGSHDLTVSAGGNAIFDSVTGTTGDITVAAGGSLSANSFSGTDITLQSTTGLNFTGSLTASGNLFLTTGTDFTNTTVANGLLAANVTLVTTGGADLGTQLNPLLLDAITEQVAVNSSGNAFIKTLNTNGIELQQAAAAGDFELESEAGILVSQDVTTTNGHIILTSIEGILEVASGVTISANGANSNLSLINLGTDKKLDFIKIGEDATLEAIANTTGFGNVLIQLGTLPPTMNASTKGTKSILYDIQGSGQILVNKGKKPSVTTAKKSDPNHFNAKNATISISNTVHKKNITLGGNVTITADPPSPGPASIDVSGNNNSETTLVSNTVQETVPETSPAQFSSLDQSLSFTPDLLTGMQELRSAGPLQDLRSAGALQELRSAGAPAARRLNALQAAMAEEDDSFVLDYSPSATEFDAKLSKASEGDIEFHPIEKGATVFAPPRNIVLKTQFGNVELCDGSIALVVSEADRLSVYNLHDQHKKSVSIKSGSRETSLAPGHHATISRFKASKFSELNPIEAIPHRNVSLRKAEGTNIYLSEFSLPNAISVIKPIRTIMTARDAHSKNMASKLIKTSAILMHLSAGAAPFEFHTRPRTVALNQIR